MEFQYTYHDTPHKIDLNSLGDGRFKAVIGAREIELSAQQQMDGTWVLMVGNRRVRGQVVSDADERYVHVDGKTLTLTAVDERIQRRKQSGSAGDLTAQMPGQVVEVLVSTGDTVQSGQTLVILEAMKMEIRVTAPTDSTVQEVFVVQGDVVERGQKLVEVTAKS